MQSFCRIPRARSAPRKAAHRAIEALEPRTLLSTFVINGTAGDDSWVITAATGQVVQNGVTHNSGSITDVQVNGLGGSDSLVIDGASIPVVFNGGSEGDTLTVNSGHLAAITAAVTFNGSTGSDTLSLNDPPAAGSGSANFTFNGGAGDFDFLQLFNYSSTAAWTCTRTTASIRADRASYSLVVNSSDIEYSYITGGTLADQFLVQSAPAGSVTELDGAGGNDSYTLGDAQSTSGILGGVHVSGGGGETDTVTVDDRASATGKSFHIDNGYVGDGAGDNLFGAGGYLFTGSIAGPMTIKLGSGADNVYALPDPMTPIYIEGNNPTSGTADFLGIAAADTANPQPVSQGAGAGYYTFGDKAEIHYTGIEQVDVDIVDPTVADSEFNSLASGHRLRFVFSEHVDFPTDGTWLDLQNLSTNTSVDTSLFAQTWDNATNSANFTFPTYANGRLPDGRYRATLFSGLPDRYGNRTAADSTIEFFVTSGAAGQDIFHLFRTSAGGATVKLYKNTDPASSPPTWTIALANLADLIIDGLGSDDRLTVWPDTGTVSSSASITFNGGAGFDTIDARGVANQPDTLGLDPAYVAINSATVFHSGVESIAFDGDGGGDVVNVGGGPPLVFLDTQRLASLTIAAGASAAMPAGADSTLVIDSLSLDPTGTLDLADNDLVVNNATYTAIFNAVIAGFGQPSGGITSSTTDGSQILALFDNTLIGATDWNGQPIGSHAVVGKYTYFGDVNFDGQVTGDDYTIVDSNLNTTPPAGLAWLSGDANLDGVVTGDDYTTIDSNLNLGVGSPLAPSFLKLPSRPHSDELG